MRTCATVLLAALWQMRSEVHARLWWQRRDQGRDFDNGRVTGRLGGVAFDKCFQSQKTNAEESQERSEIAGF